MRRNQYGSPADPQGRSYAIVTDCAIQLDGVVWRGDNLIFAGVNHRREVFSGFKCGYGGGVSVRNHVNRPRAAVSDNYALVNVGAITGETPC